MRIGVTGSSGFIGTALCALAERQGCQVVALPRAVTSRDVDGCDAIVHLAGETIDGRWTPEKKAEIERSRVAGTRAVVDAIATAANKPRVLASASGAGYYGDRGDAFVTENDGAGDDFLAHVCEKWEAEALRAAQVGVRVAVMRTGVVLGKGGALQKMMTPFRFGAGGPLGSGKQYFPWIHLDDAVRGYLFALENELSGPVNLVAPQAVTNAEFAHTLGAAMRRPALVPAPAFALRLVLGEFAESILTGQRVEPQVLRAAGFQWRYATLQGALATIVS